MKSVWAVCEGHLLTNFRSCAIGAGIYRNFLQEWRYWWVHFFFFLLCSYLPGLTLVSAISDTLHLLALLTLPGVPLWMCSAQFTCPSRHLTEKAPVPPHLVGSLDLDWHSPTRWLVPQVGSALPTSVPAAAAARPHSQSHWGPAPPTISSVAVMSRQHG